MIFEEQQIRILVYYRDYGKRDGSRTEPEKAQGKEREKGEENKEGKEAKKEGEERTKKKRSLFEQESNSGIA